VSRNLRVNDEYSKTTTKVPRRAGAVVEGTRTSR